MLNLNGCTKSLQVKKTIEIRKSIPKCNYPIDVYLYCTKGKPYLYESFSEDWWWNDGVLEPLACRYGVRFSNFELPEKFHDSESKGWNKLFNGFIVAKFKLNKVDEIYCDRLINGVGHTYFYTLEDGTYIYDKCCLNEYDFFNYLGYKGAGCKVGYAWHIDNLEIFDKHMKLNDFYRSNFDEDEAKPCNCGKHCEYSDYDYLENQSYCGIDYDGSTCPFLKVQRPPQSWFYAYKE